MSEAGGGIPRDVFMSYASGDRPIAEALAGYLEQHGIRCWMAPRDVPAGALYADAIVRAINEAGAFVLLLSRSSIGSSHVGKELERASSKRKRIIAVRLDDAPLTPAFEYFLSESQWADVAAQGRESAFTSLAEALRAGAPVPPSAAAPAAAPAPAAHAMTAAPAALAAGPAPRGRPWAPAVGALALAVALAVALAWFLRSGRSPAPAAAAANADKSIAVLPFTDMSAAHDQEYFADGMAEQILDLLAKIPSLKVIARTSSFQFKGRSEDVRVVGEKLGVATVLEGSVRKAGDRLRITAQLIRAADGSHMWSEVYDRQLNDVFRTQDEIADAVVGALKVSLLGGAPAQRPAPTSNAEAYALYLQGLAHWERYTAADSQQAREYLERATALDPNFAQAWAALAGVYGDALVFGSLDTFQAVHDRIAVTARRAIAIDPKLPDAHVALAALGFLDYDVISGERELAAALASQPDHPGALDMSIYFAITQCHLDDAERLARRLIERDPLAVDPYRGLATALWFKGQSAEAEATYRRMLAFNPNAESMHFRLALILISAGRPQEALHELESEPSAEWQAIGRVMAYDSLGRRAEAQQQLALAMKEQTGWQYQMAQVYAHRRDREGAIKWLREAKEAHDPGFLNYLKCDPMLSELRSDPRYQALLAELKLPP
ncbi:MAG TPA: TIR domain-containing protein [Steroidobacteraceae bacterium]|nr:TIR domain-containing protein [Steroidobacteraceae bacterium]